LALIFGKFTHFWCFFAHCRRKTEKTAENDLKVEVINELGQVVETSKILQGSTLTVIETDTLYNGIYFVKISSNEDSKSFKIIISK
jgi:hypothetical protein